jgi:sugar phosphate permease
LEPEPPLAQAVMAPTIASATTADETVLILKTTALVSGSRQLVPSLCYALLVVTGLAVVVGVQPVDVQRVEALGEARGLAGALGEVFAANLGRREGP